MSTTENSLSTLVVADGDEDKETYVVKHPDLVLLDQVSEQMLDRLLNEKKLRPIDKKEGHIVLGAIQGIGEAGKKFHDMADTDQNNLLAQMYYTTNLAQTNETFMVALELKPAQPTAPAGPQFGFTPMGPGGGGMGGMGMGGPRPPGPSGMPHFQPIPPQFSAQQMPPGYPPQHPYPPQGDPYAQQHPGNAYAQPHPYPSYPVPPHPSQGGYPPQGWPQQQPYPPQGAPAGGYPPYPPQSWPQQQPVQPVIIEAETDEKKSTDGSGD
jgi:hypothetical protein